MTKPSLSTHTCHICQHFIRFPNLPMGICAGDGNHYRHVLGYRHPACIVFQSLFANRKDEYGKAAENVAGHA